MAIFTSSIPALFPLLEEPEGLLLDALLCLRTNMKMEGCKLQEDRKRDWIIRGRWERPKQFLCIHSSIYNFCLPPTSWPTSCLFFPPFYIPFPRSPISVSFSSWVPLAVLLDSSIFSLLSAFWVHVQMCMCMGLTFARFISGFSSSLQTKTTKAVSGLDVLA